jgi:beta-lactamase regulating signal transducer with metallopeptidase domain
MDLVMEAYFLHLAGVLLTFILKVTAGFVLCTALATLLSNPRHRFLTWLGFILASGLSWIATLADETFSVFSGTTVNSAMMPSVVGGEHLTVPAQWAMPVERIMLAIGGLYAVGVVVMVGAKLYKHLCLRAWLRHGRCPSPALDEMFQQVCREFNIRRCGLTVLPQVSSPATVYWWTPRVIVPEICEELATTTQLRNVLRHELIHTLRCDYLWASICDFLCSLLFFHPTIWNARKRLSMQRELACDLGVVEIHPGHRADYADSLARFVRLLMLHQPPSWGVDFVGAPSLLGTRIRYILSEPPQPPRWKRAFADTALVAAIMAFAGVLPALSISISFSPDQAPTTVVSPEGFNAATAQENVNRSKPVIRSHPTSIVESVQYQDTLTTLPLRNSVDTAGYFAEQRRPAQESISDHSQWRSASFATNPEMTRGRVDMADMGRIPAGRAERREHGRDKR